MEFHIENLQQTGEYWLKRSLTSGINSARYRLTRYFRDQEPVIELYDHVTDPNETVNIAEERPDVVERLMMLWDRGNTGLYE